MKKEDKPFKDAYAKEFNELPDHIWQQITDLCTKIMVTAMHDGEKRIDMNISLGAMQKAMGLMIAKFYKADVVDEIAKKIAEGLIHNVKEWKK